MNEESKNQGNYQGVFALLDLGAVGDEDGGTVLLGDDAVLPWCLCPALVGDLHRACQLAVHDSQGGVGAILALQADQLPLWVLLACLLQDLLFSTTMRTDIFIILVQFSKAIRLSAIHAHDSLAMKGIRKDPVV